MIQYILMFSGTGFDSKLKLVFKSFPMDYIYLTYPARRDASCVIILFSRKIWGHLKLLECGIKWCVFDVVN